MAKVCGGILVYVIADPLPGSLLENVQSSERMAFSRPASSPACVE